MSNRLCSNGEDRLRRSRDMAYQTILERRYCVSHISERYSDPLDLLQDLARSVRLVRTPQGGRHFNSLGIAVQGKILQHSSARSGRQIKYKNSKNVLHFAMVKIREDRSRDTAIKHFLRTYCVSHISERYVSSWHLLQDFRLLTSYRTPQSRRSSFQ
ncbi:hypothetical protein EVAR_57743_1 [Eumeta japonica]|uniref:Uncharacterized protein n=1 Tax=Eumeta variegata TaxID=151549 RepID=A0A4C1ZS55_EUMVA|nr:hypothetical protein EVAR_57743_1 [Eumeta japonica]